MGTITVKNLGKAYKQYHSRFGRIVEWISPFSTVHHQLKWILQDINFTVAPGEALGIIGVNGAGKSTLLKMLVGTTRPTTGNVAMTGRVAALLELGMGFHPEFTGRQNVYMSGQLLGLPAVEISRLMPEIEAFAEIGDYIDQPVRVYSSGMQVRLAFSVATAIRPDILIVDEALSVGDSYFQHKSFERIREFRRKGTTLLIVSHDKQAIISVCDKAILLNGGQLEKIGTPEAIMDYYNALLAKKEDQNIVQTVMPNGATSTTSGTGEAYILSIKLVNYLDQEVQSIDVGEVITLKIKVQTRTQIPKLVLGFLIKDRLGQAIHGTNTHHLQLPLLNLERNEIAEYSIKFSSNLGPGSYSLAVALTANEAHYEKNYEWRDLALIFNVINNSKPIFAGNVWLAPEVSMRRIPNNASC